MKYMYAALEALKGATIRRESCLKPAIFYAYGKLCRNSYSQPAMLTPEDYRAQDWIVETPADLSSKKNEPVTAQKANNMLKFAFWGPDQPGLYHSQTHAYVIVTPNDLEPDAKEAVHLLKSAGSKPVQCQDMAQFIDFCTQNALKQEKLLIIQDCSASFFNGIVPPDEYMRRVADGRPFDLVFWDTHLQDRIDDAHEKKWFVRKNFSKAKFNANPRGGTDMSRAIEAFAFCDDVCVITDGYTEWNHERKPKNLKIVITSEAEVPEALD